MAKRPTRQANHSWAVYHIRGTPAQFVGRVVLVATPIKCIGGARSTFGISKCVNKCSQGGKHEGILRCLRISRNLARARYEFRKGDA
jgi:hypothetical protein